MLFNFPAKLRLAMGAGILPDLWTQILIPVCAVIGIAFSIFQWILVSKVKLTVEKHSPPAGEKNGHTDSLIEEEEGINDHTVVQKCAEIQSAISEGEQFLVLSYSTELILYLFFSFF